jgi:hypothetical protein
MKSRLRFAVPVTAVLMAACVMNCRAQTVTEVCNSASDTIQGRTDQYWRFTVTITSSTAALQTRSLDVFLDLSGGTGPVVSGQLYSGVTEQSINLNTSSPPNSSGNCVVYAQSFSLLGKNGAPYGTRIGQYVVFVSDTYVLYGGGPIDINIASRGLVQFTDYDLSGNVLSLANGTFTGVIPNIFQNIDNTDPFWSQTPQ